MLSRSNCGVAMLSGGLVTLLAVLIDRVSGEPAWLYRRVPHPAVIFGTAIDWADRWFNKPVCSPLRQRLIGLAVLLASLLVFSGLGLAFEWVLAAYVGPAPVRLLLLAVLASSLIASKSLFDHVGAVARPLAAHDLPSAREALALIVGRQTATLDEAAVSRAATETLAENFSDGIVAPVFWLAVGGLPGLIAYKVINTADSMIGHRTEKYLYFGWAAARLDDAANLIPARLNAGLFTLTALSPGFSARGSWRATSRDARHHASPNAGWPEAAMAGAVGIRLGGPRDYGSYRVDGHWINTGGTDANSENLKRALSLAKRSWWVMAFLLILLTVGDQFT